MLTFRQYSTYRTLRKEFDVKEYRENLRITAQACIMNTMYCD